MDKKKIMIVLSVAILVLIVIGSSYAYFVVGVSERAERNIRVTTSTTDTLLFEMGEDLAFKATQSEFIDGGKNATGKTTAKAILKANNETNKATDHYYFYLDINKNDFVYTSDEQTAELILTIKNGNEPITSIEGLEYVTVGSVSGFDITESTDLIKIAENKEISATSANNNTTTDNWELTITFVNLDNNQNDNAGRTFEAKMIMQKEKINNLFADYLRNAYTSDGVNGMYLHDSDLANGANDNSLRYTGYDYALSDTAKNAGYENVDQVIDIGEIDDSSGKGLILFYCDSVLMNVNENCASGKTTYYSLRYNTSAHFNTYTEVLDQAASDGYLTRGNVNNFVCFGSDAETCPSDNLYRIIGVFDNHVKLIKYDYANSTLLGEDGNYRSTGKGFYFSNRGSEPNRSYRYLWSNGESKIINGTTYTNIWRLSNLNKINLNLNYLNNIGDKWRSLITGTTFKFINKTSFERNTLTDANAYLEEKNQTDFTMTYKGRVGLMNLSDYGYAKIKNSNLVIQGNSWSSIDWMFMGSQEWILSLDGNTIVVITNNHNTLYTNSNKMAWSIRPVFYLSSGASYVSGNGTKANPYKIR